MSLSDHIITAVDRLYCWFWQRDWTRTAAFLGLVEDMLLRFEGWWYGKTGCFCGR